MNPAFPDVVNAIAYCCKFPAINKIIPSKTPPVMRTLGFLNCERFALSDRTSVEDFE